MTPATDASSDAWGEQDPTVAERTASPSPEGRPTTAPDVSQDTQNQEGLAVAERVASPSAKDEPATAADAAQDAQDQQDLAVAERVASPGPEASPTAETDSCAASEEEKALEEDRLWREQVSLAWGEQTPAEWKQSRWEDTELPLPPPSAPGRRDFCRSLILEAQEDDEPGTNDWESSNYNGSYTWWLRYLWRDICLPGQIQEAPFSLGVSTAPDISLTLSLSDVANVENLNILFNAQVKLRQQRASYDSWPSRAAAMFSGDFIDIYYYIHRQNPTWPMTVEAVITKLARAGQLNAAGERFIADCSRTPSPEHPLAAILRTMRHDFVVMSPSHQQAAIASRAILDFYRAHAPHIEKQLDSAGRLYPLTQSLEWAIIYADREEKLQAIADKKAAEKEAADRAAAMRAAAERAAAKKAAEERAAAERAAAERAAAERARNAVAPPAFGYPPPSTTGGLFGGGQPVNTGGLFGGGKPAAAGGLFGPVQHQPSSNPNTLFETVVRE